MKKLNQDNRLHACPKPVIGLTGGIATGKSTFSKILQEKGCAVICADRLVKEVYNERDTKKFVQEKYPECIVNKEIDFSTLRTKAFGDPEVLQTLETFLYARMPNVFCSKVEDFPLADFIVYDVPLLFEKDIDKVVDITVCVYAPEAVQLERLIKRDGITNELAKEMLEKQIPIEKKRELSDFVVENVQDIKALEIKADGLIREIERIISIP